jgi:VCBS repeat protein
VFASSVTIADVNGDGKPDIVLASACDSNGGCPSNSVGIMLGNGDGTFESVVTYDSGGLYPDSVAVADVNRDGKPDIIVANGCANGNDCPVGSVAVLLGNGDGSFQDAVAYAVGADTATSVAVADVNGDGKPDLAVTTTCSNCTIGDTGRVSVLLGKGDGTFQSAVIYSVGGDNAYSVALADVNGDGNVDVVVTTACFKCGVSGAGNVGVLLGNGNGTFKTWMTFWAGGGFHSNSVVVADVNGDGKPDVMVATCNFDLCVPNGEVGVLINTTPSPYNAHVQQPINADGSSVFKAIRGVVPVKFRLTENGEPTCILPSATIALTRTAGSGTLGSVAESTYFTHADTGSNFRIDSSACQYIYNLATSSLAPGTYQVDIRIYGFVAGNAVFALE